VAVPFGRSIRGALFLSDSREKHTVLLEGRSQPPAMGGVAQRPSLNPWGWFKAPVAA